jgi:enoyl-CoA hydratase
VSDAQLAVERPRPGVVLVRLNRPGQLNALTFEMLAELRRLRAELAAADADRVVVFTGAGRGFCAGFDLDQAARMGALPDAELYAGQQEWARATSGYRELPKPVIAAVNGPSAGAGLALALAADIRIASPDASFSAAFIRLGLSGADSGVSWMLPRLVGLGHAAEMMMTGERIDAARAERIGLVNRVVPAAGLLDEALALAERLAALDPLALRLTKEALQANVDAPSLGAALALENRNQVLGLRTDAHHAALAALRERTGSSDPDSRRTGR